MFNFIKENIFELNLISAFPVLSCGEIIGIVFLAFMVLCLFIATECASLCEELLCFYWIELKVSGQVIESHIIGLNKSQKCFRPRLCQSIIRWLSPKSMHLHWGSIIHNIMPPYFWTIPKFFIYLYQPFPRPGYYIIVQSE